MLQDIRTGTHVLAVHMYWYILFGTTYFVVSSLHSILGWDDMLMLMESVNKTCHAHHVDNPSLSIRLLP